MIRYAIRRFLFSIPTLFAISLIVFSILKLAPGDPTSNLPLTIPAEQREAIREAMGFNEPFFQQYLNWMKLMLWNEPLHLINETFGVCLSPGGACEELDRMISWQSRSPALDRIYERVPQTLWVLGLGLLFGVLIAVPIGTMQAYRQYSLFDNAGTVVTMLGFSVPVFVIGPLLIWLFAVPHRSFLGIDVDWGGWLPSSYQTTHDVDFTSLSSIWIQIKQLILPVSVLTLFNAAQFGRFTRASVLENLNESFVRTARSKGLAEGTVMNRHVLRNSLIPVVTLLALSIPGIFGGAIITESIFSINGLGEQLLLSIRQNDLFMVQSLVFIFAFLTVLFNIIADILYGLLDPRIRYD